MLQEPDLRKVLMVGRMESEKRLTRRRALGLLGALGTSAAISACEGAGDRVEEPVQTTPGPPITAPVETSTPVPEEARTAPEQTPMPYPGVEIEFKFNSLSVRQETAIRELAKFEDLTGISIVPDFSWDWGFCGQVCTPAPTPDIWYGLPYEIPYGVAAGNLLELDVYLDTWSEWTDYYPVVKQEVAYEDRYFGIPISSSYGGSIVIRPSMFEAAGLPAEPPNSWEELNEITPRLTIRDGEQFQQAGINVRHGARVYEDWLLQAGGSPLSRDLSSPRNYSPNGKIALVQHIRHGLTDKTMPIEGMDPHLRIIPFCGGRIAIEQLWPGWARSCENTAPKVFADLTAGPPLQGPGLRAMHISVQKYLARKDTEHPDAVFETLKYFAAPGPNFDLNISEGGAMPCRGAMEEYETYALEPWRTFAANLRFARNPQVTRQQSDVQRSMDRWIESAALGESSIDETLRGMDADIEIIIGGR